MPCLAGARLQATLSHIQFKALRTIYAPKKDHLRRVAETSGASPISSTRWEERVVAELDSDLTKWFNSIPPYLKWDDKRALKTDMDKLLAVLSARLHVKYFGTQILVHREYVNPQKQGVLTWPSLSICQNSARSLCHIVAYLTRSELLRYCWFDIPLQTTNTATLLLLSISEAKKASSEINQSILSDIQKCIDAMLHLQSISYIAHQTIIGLKELCDVQGIDHGLRFELPQRPKKNLAARASSAAGAASQTLQDGSNSRADAGQMTRRSPDGMAVNSTTPSNQRLDSSSHIARSQQTSSPFSTVSAIHPGVTNPASSTNQDPSPSVQQVLLHEHFNSLQSSPFPYLSQQWKGGADSTFSAPSSVHAPSQGGGQAMPQGQPSQYYNTYPNFDSTVPHPEAWPQPPTLSNPSAGSMPHWSENPESWQKTLASGDMQGLLNSVQATGSNANVQEASSRAYPSLASGMSSAPSGDQSAGQPSYSNNPKPSERTASRSQDSTPDTHNQPSSLGFHWENFLPGMPAQGMHTANWLNHGSGGPPPSDGLHYIPYGNSQQMNIVHAQQSQQYSQPQPQHAQSRPHIPSAPSSYYGGQPHPQSQQQQQQQQVYMTGPPGTHGSNNQGAGSSDMYQNMRY